MKKLYVFFICLLSMQFSYGANWPGSGTAADPYLIDDLGSIDGVYASVYFKLTRSYSGGSLTSSFRGYLDGNYQTITLNDGYLMTELKGADIKNLTIKNGGFAKTMTSGTISYCKTIGSSSNAGGIVYQLKGGLIVACENNMTLTSGKGGIAAEVYGTSKIIGCSNTGNITFNGYIAGGIVGELIGKSSILCCYNRGTITIQNQANNIYIGGIAGSVTSYPQETPTIARCYNTGSLKFSKCTGKLYMAHICPVYDGGGYYHSGVTYSPYPGYTGGVYYEDVYNSSFVTKLNNGLDSTVFIRDIYPNYVNDGYPIVPKYVNVDVNSANTTMGATSGSGNYKQGTSIVLTATPKEHYHFLKWNDDDINASRSITVTTAATYTATFAPDTYVLTVNSANTTMGTVTGGGSYDYNKKVSITATPKEHYHFVKWNDGNTNASRSVTVTGNATYTATFAIDTHVLTITSANTTMGTVTGSGTYEYNKSVTIKATPKTGYHFVKWNDGNTNASRSVTVTGAATYTATFAIDTYALTVTSANTNMGTVTGGGTYDYNSSVTIKATPKEHYHFVKWSDGNTNASRTVTVTKAATYTANFAIDTHVLTVTSANTTMGTVTGGGTYDYNKSVSIVATPKTGYSFVKWNDGNTTASRSVTVTGDATYTATFQANSYNITAQSANETMGTVSGSGSYKYATTQTISATPAEHYHFQKWNDGNTDNPRSITIAGDATYTATFAIDTHELTVTSADEIMGTVTGSGTYDYNSSVTIKATPKTGYHFVKWDDDDTNASRSVTITGDAAYTATFEANSYDITVLSVDESTGTVSGSGSYKYATTQTISATPVEHYHFQKWNDGNTENPRSITIAGTATYTATFVLDTFALAITVNDATMGTTSGSGGYAYNSSAMAQATPNYGYVFKKWNDGNTDNPRSVVITQNTNYVANFVLDTFNITASSNDVEKGTVTGSGKYPYNTDAILSANAVQHYHFVKWNDNDVDNPRTVTVTKDASYTAVFAIDTFAISAVANDSEMGTVTGSGNYIYGSEQDIDATANYGYVFKNWKDGETAAQRTITVTKNATYTAMFEKDIFSVFVSSTDESKGTVSAGGELEYLSEVQLVATPKEHYHFVQWSDGNTDATRTITVTKDLNLSAEFAIDTFELNIAESENGTVSGDGEYVYNTTATLTATPNEHYHFVKWSDGETINPRQITVTESATYKAEFAIDEFVVSLSADATMGTVQGADTYAYGQTITISAQPKYGYVFTQWSDGDTSESREIVVSENLQLEAQFEKAVFSVNIVSNDESKGSISVTGEPEYLSEIQLEATPKEHYHFVQWSDGDANATRTVVVTEDMNLTAEFAIDTFEVAIGECENGTITGSGEYAYNTEATLTAVPSEHYHFIKWGDGETVNPRQVTITENASFTAEFAIDTFTVALSSDATMGTVQGMGSYTYGTTVDISAVPNYGYVFKQWSDGNDEATRSIVVSDNVQLEAQFENATFNVQIVSNDESKGTVSVVGEMVYDSEIQMDAIAKEHYHFVKWSDGNVENPRNVTIKEDFNLTAEFAIDTFTVTISVNKSEMGTIQGAGDYTYGQEATLVAEANDHYTFVKWDDGVTDEERVVTITDNVTYKAIFEKAVYNITAESLDETMGTVKILGDSFTYGDEVVLMATAKSGFHFVKWSDGNEEAARTVEVSGNKIFVAYFEANSTAIDDISNELLITIVNRQILVNGEAPAFVVTVSGQKIANANLKAGVYFMVVDGNSVSVVVR